MKRTIQWLVVAALLIGAASVTTAQGRPDEIAAVVNGETISTWEIGLLFPQIQKELESQGLSSKGDIVIRTALQRAIDNRLLAQEARRLGIEPNDERVNEKLRAISGGAGGQGNLEAELIKVEEIVIGTTVPLEEVHPAARNLLQQQRTGQVLDILVAELRANTEVRDPQPGD